MTDVLEDNWKNNSHDAPSSRATVKDNVLVGFGSQSRESESPSPSRSQTRSTYLASGKESDIEEVSSQRRHKLWEEGQAPLTKSVFHNPSNIASIAAQRARAPAAQQKIQKPPHIQDTNSTSQTSPNIPNVNSVPSRASSTERSQMSQLDNYDLVLQPETRPISQEDFVAEVKAIYAGLVLVEARCIEIDNKQATLAQADPGALPKLNNEQWQALVALHRTLLHEHHDFFLASQNPSASPALRQLGSKYALPARMWRHAMLASLELLKDHLPPSPDDLHFKLNFLQLAYTMMDLLHEINPAFEETWIQCLADFDHHLRAIKNNYRDTDLWTNIVKEWYSDVSRKLSTVLSYVPKIYAKSSSFFRKAIRISINGKECLARPDSGSEKDVCSEDFAHQHKLHISRNDEDRVLFQLGTRTKVRSIGRVRVRCSLSSGRSPPKERWFYVLKKCAAPIIVGDEFIEETSLYVKNKHLLERCPNWFGRFSTLKYLGSSKNRIWFTAEGYAMNGLADTGSDEDFMSLECAKRNGFKIDRQGKARMLVQQADGSIVETVGQVWVSVKIGPMDEFKMNFQVLRDLSEDAIFSEEFLEQTNGFINLIKSPKFFEDVDAADPEAAHSLNTLVNLGPINAYANRTRATAADGTPEQDHDSAVVDEIYRRNKVSRVIRRTSDLAERMAAEEADILIKNAFDLRHANCAICIQRSNPDSGR